VCERFLIIEGKVSPDPPQLPTLTSILQPIVQLPCLRYRVPTLVTASSLHRPSSRMRVVAAALSGRAAGSVGRRLDCAQLRWQRAATSLGLRT